MLSREVTLEHNKLNQVCDTGQNPDQKPHRNADHVDQVWVLFEKKKLIGSWTPWYMHYILVIIDLHFAPILKLYGTLRLKQQTN